MRKNYRPIILACLMISLGYWLFPILTSRASSTAVSSAPALPERRAKNRPYQVQFAQEGKLVEEPRTSQNIVKAVQQQTQQSEGYPVLIHYLTQLSPVDKNELDSVLTVAAEARLQLLSDQASTLNSLESAKQSLRDLSQALDGDFAATSSHYLEHLDQRRHIQREMALLEEEIQGWKLEAGSGSHRTRELAEADATRQSLQSSLDALRTEIHAYEDRLAGANTRDLLGPQYSSFCEKLKTYHTALGAALDQDVIIDKFDTIFAAMSSVQLEDI